MRLMVFVLKAPPPDWRTDEAAATTKLRTGLTCRVPANLTTVRSGRSPARPPAPTDECRRRSSQMRSCKIGCLALAAAYLVSLPPSLLVFRAAATSKE